MKSARCLRLLTWESTIHHFQYVPLLKIHKHGDFSMSVHQKNHSSWLMFLFWTGWKWLYSPCSLKKNVQLLALNSRFSFQLFHIIDANEKHTFKVYIFQKPAEQKVGGCSTFRQRHSSTIVRRWYCCGMVVCLQTYHSHLVLKLESYQLP